MNQVYCPYCERMRARLRVLYNERHERMWGAQVAAYAAGFLSGAVTILVLKFMIDLAR